VFGILLGSHYSIFTSTLYIFHLSHAGHKPHLLQCTIILVYSEEQNFLILSSVTAKSGSLLPWQGASSGCGWG